MNSIIVNQGTKDFFGKELKEEKYLDRPLSKMKHDILHEMGVI